MKNGIRLGLMFLLFAAIAGDVRAQTPAPAGTRRILLIRHGEYNHDDPAAEDVGKGLTPLGMAQARLVAARLRTLPLRIDLFTSSYLTRARESARIIVEDFPGIELRADSLLNECTPPTWRKDIMEKAEPGETEACQKQLDEAFRSIFQASASGDRCEVLVCHGNVIRYFVTKALGVDTMAWLNMGVANCSLTEIQVRPDGSTKVLMVGDVGHIPPNLQTGLDSKDRNLKVPERIAP